MTTKLKYSKRTRSSPLYCACFMLFIAGRLAVSGVKKVQPGKSTLGQDSTSPTPYNTLFSYSGNKTTFGFTGFRCCSEIQKSCFPLFPAWHVSDVTYSLHGCESLFCCVRLSIQGQ
ncbi:hypothetical protein BgiBS90_024080, partial [Biomphalaria glabrata]